MSSVPIEYFLVGKIQTDPCCIHFLRIECVKHLLELRHYLGFLRRQRCQ